MSRLSRVLGLAVLLALPLVPASAQVAIKGKTIYTMAGPPLKDGVVILRDSKIAAIGPAATTPIPDGFRILEATIVTPGLIDAHTCVGLTGILNIPHDQEQLDRSAAMQPELRAIDAYNPQDKLVDWLRSFGITTVHTGHAPEALIPGQTAIVKTTGNTVGDAVIVETAAIAAVIGNPARREEKGQSPGTRGKMMALLRAEFIKTQEYLKKLDATDPEKKPARDLKLETLSRVLKGEIPLILTANRAQDIASALRLAEEFKIRLWLDGAAESYLLIEPIKAAGIPVIVHPSMMRAYGEMENMSFETAAKLKKAGIPIALQSGFEDYVPKTRVALFEAALTAANGLTFDEALGTITLDAAKILGIDKRVGSLEIGKDGDVALFDGDPFEYTSHCIGTVIDGKVVSEVKR